MKEIQKIAKKDQFKNNYQTLVNIIKTICILKAAVLAEVFSLAFSPQTKLITITFKILQIKNKTNLKNWD